MGSYTNRKIFDYFTLDAKVLETFSRLIQNTTHFQSINISRMSFEVLDIDFSKQTCASTEVNSKYTAEIFTPLLSKEE